MKRSARTSLALLGAAAIATAASGIGVAAVSDGATPRSGLIHACIANGANAGQLYYLRAGASCKSGWHEITWNGRGRRGPVGPAGPTGTNGAAGAAGQPGATGNTILNGTSAPTPTTGTNGDFYLNTSTNTLYGPKTTNGWGNAVSLVGPAGVGYAGPPGAPGAPGAPGQNGAPGPGEIVYTATGNHDYTVPAGVTHVLVTLRGAGGGGGTGTASSSQPNMGWSSGGGGQGALLTVNVPVAAGDVLSVAVGAGTFGNQGGDSTVTLNGTTLGTAGGGAAGSPGTIGSAGAGGAGGEPSVTGPATAIDAHNGAAGNPGQTVNVDTNPPGGLGGGVPAVAGSGAQGEITSDPTGQAGYATVLPEA
jgi:hypothetical protein